MTLGTHLYLLVTMLVTTLALMLVIMLVMMLAIMLVMILGMLDILISTLKFLPSQDNLEWFSSLCRNLFGYSP